MNPAALLASMRPHQWVKNAFVVAPLIFARQLTNWQYAMPVVAATIIFCVLSGTVYVLNDLVDVEADRRHPKKKLRPIASGAVSEGTARGFISAAVIACLVCGWLLSPGFLAAALSYFVGNLAYSFSLKKIAYIDVVWIGTGFLLRLLAGSLAPTPAIPLSYYLLITTFLLALFLGFGKRLHELGGTGTATRGVLAHYSPKAARILLILAGLGALVAYAQYTLDAKTVLTFGTSRLWVTVLPAALAMLRFGKLVSAKNDDSPTDAMLHDPIFLGAGLTTGALMLYFLYGS